jgi:hypothetical protein
VAIFCKREEKVVERDLRRDKTYYSMCLTMNKFLLIELIKEINSKITLMTLQFSEK